MQILNCVARFDRIVERAIADNEEGKVWIHVPMPPEEEYAENEYLENDAEKNNTLNQSFSLDIKEMA